MKYNRIVPILALAVILSLLMIATPALAQTTVQVYPTQGPATTTVTVTGGGFAANGTITVSYDGTQVGTATITPNGNFDVSFTATGAVGSHDIISTDGTNSVTSTFTITTAAATTDSTSPPTPEPLLPIMGGKATSKARFDWESVGADHPSQPITYTLQIASDSAFATILLDKTGLTTSEYTLTEVEKLQPATEGTLYYWRVKAIDAASNASGWTGAGIFHVGAAFELTGPILYVVIVLGYILVFFLCFWISRSGAR